MAVSPFSGLAANPSGVRGRKFGGLPAIILPMRCLMAMRTVADALVQTLVRGGVNNVYGVVGDSLNAFTDAIRRTPGMQWRHVRHEESAAFAAGAEAHLTGRLAVCAGSCGPGNLHLINGLFDCHRSRVPVLAIAAQIPSSELGTGYFQETNPAALFKDCSHYCGSVTHPRQLLRILPIAINTAISRSGVAVIIISGDVASQRFDMDSAPTPLVTDESVVAPDDRAVVTAAEILNKAKNIAILAGAGCKNAHTELIQTADQLAAPIVHALRGKEFIEYDNPFDVGMTGLLGFSSGYHAMKNCDALLMLGTDFPYPQFFPDKARVIQVDRLGEQIGRRTRIDLGIVGSVRNTLKQLLPQLKRHDNRGYLDLCLKHYQKTRKQLDDLAVGKPGRTPLHPQYVTRQINAAASDDAVFTCDVGTPTIWAARYLTMNGRRRLLGSFTHGSMAGALPQAIGAQCAYPDRQVVVLCGDGGLSMLMGELLTVRQLKLPVKIFVFNNSSLGFVELEMKAAGLIDFGTELQNPDFARMAEAIGIRGIRVEKPEQLDTAINAALSRPGPVLVDAVVNRQELSMPPSITADQAFGFGLYLLRAVISGRGDEVIDLAKTNLRR
jgi:pyruvate dehydrogenase (quinone)